MSTHEPNQRAERVSSKELRPSDILEFLKKTNVVNTDVSLGTLLEHTNTLNAPIDTMWGFVFDTGHYALVWKT